MKLKSRLARLPALLPHIGMRTVKTVVAVFICLMIDYMRGAVPMQSTIAAIICMQPDRENTLRTSFARIIATAVGGLCAAGILMLSMYWGFPNPSIPFYCILPIVLLPLIMITVGIGWSSATALTCVVFLVITLGYDGEHTPIYIALNRIADTLVGILVAVPVNLLLPGSHPSDQQEPPQEPEEEIEHTDEKTRSKS